MKNRGSNQSESPILAWLKNAWHVTWDWVRRYWHRFQLTRWLIVIALSLFLVLSIDMTFQAKTAKVSDLKNQLENPTVIYDKDNHKAGTLYSQKGSYVPLKKISPSIQKAVISTEDRHFYSEHGFSVRGIGRAMWLLVKNKIMGRDYISGGGSTLTQQLVKNAYLTQEQTFSRKIKEIFLSIEVENIYSKKDILTMYLNNAYFGNGVWGVQDASERYFGKPASELTTAESAVIAGMLTSPSAYNPVDHPQAALERRNVVLGLMADTKSITTSEAKQAEATPIETADNYSYNDSYKYPYYFDAVINEAVNKYGLSESDIMNRGYKIYTSLDQNHQENMQSTFKNDANFPTDAADGTKVQAASIAVDPSTGGVEAVVGGRGKHVFRGYNRATQMKRQPGSTIKPIAVYTPALQNGYFYDSELSNERRSYGSNKYRPKNWNNQYSEKMTMYDALAQSMNAPAVWLLNKIGVQKGYDSVKKFGLPVTKSDDNLALALGGLKTGVSPMEMASAYTAYANQGNLNSAHFITKVVDASGKTVVSSGETASQPKQVMSAKVAKQMTSMMLGVFNYGTGTDAKPYGYSVAGKTGSTEDVQSSDSEATRDKWVIGYTPDVVVATWEGYDSNDKSHVLEDTGTVGVGTLFRTEMQEILPNTKGTQFDTKDASDLAKSESSSDNDLWGRVQDGAKSAQKTVESWWDKAKSFF
ncbi:PBP1A family penicillin-binding protein [Levilactobacillus bambusae]|uniref:Penicillin-binding protein n=1 Tax=Levilactobacillus bambusae TaxID=2024736 RepID=A0A2V1N5K4_9LACO|nr:PBP1A family penicillin-binding protein [Levilactobacillus bambusae]PWG01055.1 penicillin-binding protein [Levilactobacillus bambusae]